MGEKWRVHQFAMQGRVIQYFQRGIAGMQATQESNTRCANYPIMMITLRSRRRDLAVPPLADFILWVNKSPVPGNPLREATACGC